MPPDIFGKPPEDAEDVAWLLGHLGSAEPSVIHDAVRLITGSISDFLDDYFESEILKGYLAASSTTGTKVGPMSAGSGLVSLMMMMGEHDGHLGSWSFHKGGNGGFTQLLARAARGVRSRDPPRLARRPRRSPKMDARSASSFRTAPSSTPTSSSARSTPDRPSPSWSTPASCPTTWSRASTASSSKARAPR